MNFIKGIISLLLMISPFIPAYSQDTKQTSDTTVRFWVNGLCEMCQDRIQNALKHKGVRQATWDIPTREVEVVYDPAVITLDKLHKWIADVGHDTKLRKAKNITYQSLPDCCRYREKKEHEASEADKQTQEIDSASKPGSENEKIEVRGIVLEVDKKGNFHPLPGASIHWLDIPGFTLSDSNGIFRLPIIENKRKLIISYTGYEPDTILVTSSQEMKIVLAAGKQLQVVEVKGRQRASYLSSGVVRTQIMTERELFKAACCNLSESFETNPSVDVAYSDAVTGAKQIQMLGLSGSYTQLTVENLPGPRGLATPLGLNYIPGPWVESIQLTKGIGSVANGFESIAGQINVEMKKPEKAQPLFANVYVNDMGKVDLNLDLTTKLNDKWSTTLLLHDNFLNNKVDGNMDMFRDVPTGNLATILSRWKYDDSKGFMVQFGFKFLKDNKVGGVVDFNPDTDKYSTHHYGLGIETGRYEGFLKVGYVFPEKKYKSIGWQFSGYKHDQQSYFGAEKYNAKQNNFYSNLIYQSIIGTTANKFRTGISFVSDKYDEQFQLLNFKRKEVVPGAFFEYTYSYLDKFSVVAGIRADHNNLYGWFATPRLHVRYEPMKGTTLRLAAGRGQRTANILAENMSVFASSRQVQILQTGAGKAYGLDPEVAWNMGISLDQKFSLFERNGNISLDYYYTYFDNQVVVDLENARAVRFYNLDGKSYSSSFQAEINYELARKLELRLAYRNYEVKTTYGSQLLDKPLVARDRAFANLAYEAGAWKFDYTVTLTGTKRIPSTSINPLSYQRPTHSPSFVMMNAQVSRSIGAKKKFEVYLGAENLTDFYQKDVIIAANDPFGPYFDASLVWGPVYGRMFYGGVRVALK